MSNNTTREHSPHDGHVPPYAVLFIFTACCIGGKILKEKDESYQLVDMEVVFYRNAYD